MPIHQWPEEDRPREKLILKGAQHLTNAELLAIFLGSGLKGKSALDLAKELLLEFGQLPQVITAHLNEFSRIEGLGKAKYAVIQAAVELGRRYQAERVVRGQTLAGPPQTQQFLAEKIQGYSIEVFACIFLDSRNRILAYEELFHGTLNEACIYPREVVKKSLSHNAAKVIFGHNHPSGDPTPSQADQEITVILKEALSLIGTQVVDHIVIGESEHFSFADHGLI